MKTYDVSLSYNALYVYHIEIEADDEDDAELRAKDWLKEGDNDATATECASFAECDEWEIQCFG
ncbi:MAG: hypothetical protein V3V08_07255 [Nannocystaceae bacterium]